MREGPHPQPAVLTKQLYRVQEVTEALGLSRSTIYEQMRAQRLRSVKVGRSRRIPVEAIGEFIELVRREAEDIA